MTDLSPDPHVVRRGTGVPVVFLHGNAVDHRLLLGLDDVFATDGQWERFHLDLPGFGATPALPEPGGLPEIADWIDDTVTALLGDRSFAVVGMSMGGLLARDLAARRPEQCLGLALLAPVVDPVHANRTVPEPVVLAEDPDLIASLDPADATAYTQLAVVQSRENWERFRTTALPGLRAADVDAMDRLAQHYVLDPAPDGRLSGFDRPVLIVTGLQDAVVGFEDQEALARLFPRSTVVTLDRAGHNVHLDQPDRVRAALAEWAEDVLGDG